MDYASCLSATERRTTAAKRDDFHSKSLFLVKKIKDNGTQKAVQRQRMGILLHVKIFLGTFGFEMRACGQKLVKLFTLRHIHTYTHTTTAKLVVRI